MFPFPNRPARPAHAWLDALRDGLDLLVAFATLRDAEAPPETDEITCAAGVSWPPADTIRAATAAGRRRAAERAGRPVATERSERSTRQRAADRSEQRAADRSEQRAADRSEQRAADRSEQRAADQSEQRADRSGRRAADGAEPPAAHPHRRPLRPATRLRRPGAVRPEPQACLTPVVARRTRSTRAPARGARHA